MGVSQLGGVERWIPRAYWLGFGILLGQVLLVGYSLALLPDVINLGSFAGTTKTGPKATLWVFPAASALMLALPWLTVRLPASGLSAPQGRTAEAPDHKLARLLVVSMFVFFAGCVSVGQLACVLENFGHPAAVYGQPVVAVLSTVVPPIMLLLFAWSRQRSQLPS